MQNSLRQILSLCDFQGELNLYDINTSQILSSIHTVHSNLKRKSQKIRNYPVIDQSKPLVSQLLKPTSNFPCQLMQKSQRAYPICVNKAKYLLTFFYNLP